MTEIEPPPPRFLPCRRGVSLSADESAVLVAIACGALAGACGAARAAVLLSTPVVVSPAMFRAERVSSPPDPRSPTVRSL